MPFKYFELSDENFINYYYKNPEKPFCKTFINPKLKLLLDQFSGAVVSHKVAHLKK